MAAWRDFPLPDGSYSDETRPFSQQDVVNYLPTIAERNGTRSPVVHKTAPGLKTFARIGDGPHRGAHNCEGRRFIVSGRKLYQVDKDGVATDRGTIPGTGRVTMAHNQIANGNQVLIGTVDNSYLWDTTTSTLAATGVALQSVDFLNQRFLGVDQQRRFWRHSALADGASWNDLDVYSSESSPDRIVGLKVLDGQVYVFNERTIEVFVDQPTETQVYQRSVVIQRGCISGDSIVRIAGTLFFVGDDYIPYRLDGYTPVPIGTKPITSDLSGTDPRKLFGFGWEDRGYLVYYITAQNGHTWGYDVTNGKWHRRESYGLDRWRINTLVKFEQDWYAGDYATGLMYRLDWGYVYEGCEIMPRKLRTGVLHNASNRVQVHGFRLVAATGQPPIIPTQIEAQYPDAYLLVTGQAVTEGGPLFAAAKAEPGFSFTGIAQSTGATVPSGAPAYYDGVWGVFGNESAVISTDDRETWESVPFVHGSVQNVAPGPGGWITEGEVGPAGAFDRLAKADPVEGGFDSSQTFVATWPPGGMYFTHGEETYFCKYSGGYYWLDVGIQGYLVKTDDLSLSTYTCIYGRTDGIVAFKDIEVVGNSVYAVGIQGGTPQYMQLRRSTDGGVTFPETLVTVAGVEPSMSPFQLAYGNGKLLCISMDGSHCYTSDDDFSEAHATGIAGDAGGTPQGYNRPRQIAYASGRFYLVSRANTITPSLGNKCVSTADGITISAPSSTGLLGVIGIAASADIEAPEPVADICTPMDGGVFQLRYSNDGAENWSNWRDFESPTTGRFLQPLVARRLGMARHRVWEIMDTSNAAQDVLAASIIVDSE